MYVAAAMWIVSHFFADKTINIGPGEYVVRKVRQRLIDCDCSAIRAVSSTVFIHPVIGYNCRITDFLSCSKANGP
jgi:hypothetical protein